ncbi:MAG: DNA topoisomerase (ATP-hydrolyzing) subunit A [Alphaproteobacteria bacterium]|jgi:DNA gyrase subunit A|nr:DNA topoisomerase (ATP-hydrolyzing) subunit A [Alphaproteobacteria bacterium]
MSQESNHNNHQNLLPVSLEDEMKKSYLDYAMSVIVSRAIPDVCDGLKPVHRRIIYSMNETGCYHNKPHKKSARIVGEVMGKYHPHGDSAIYDALVRMAQDFSMRSPLIDGQGNFGSMDGDSPAAMRYTESRMAKISAKLIDDIDKGTVDFRENYDGSEKEPEVLPAKFPNLLVNGAGGIAVGMATNIPPHNLGEVIDATCAYIDNHNITLEELINIVPAPDFPTGGIILGRSGSRSAASTGRGSVIIRAKTHFEEIGNGKTAIIATEIPYQVNKAKLIEKIAELVRDKKIEGITDLRDESNKSGVRVVIELRRDIIAEVALNQLYNLTQLQTSFGVNLLALNNGSPKQMNLYDVLKAFVEFRENVITRRSIFLLNKAREKAHLLIGLTLAVDSIDEVIATIRSSKDTLEAKKKLLSRKWAAGDAANLIELIGDLKNEIVDKQCYFTEEQVQAILDMRLAKLTGLEREKLADELMVLKKEIEYFLDLLSSRDKILNIMKTELLEIKDEFATPRRSQIDENEFEHDIEDLIAEEDVVLTVTMEGYIKRVPLTAYRAQKRGGKGRAGLKKEQEDILVEMFVTSTHAPVLFFSNFGQVYRLKAYKIPQGSATSKGRALINIFPLKDGEKITTIMPLPKEQDEWSGMNLVFATRQGGVRRSDMDDFKNIQSNGKIAIRLDDNDSLVSVSFCADNDHILLASKFGKSLRFPLESLRVIKSRTSSGVRGMKLANGDEVISQTVLKSADFDAELKAQFFNIDIVKRKELAETEDFSILDEVFPETEVNKAKLLDIAKQEQFILSITENGYGKRSSSIDYRITNRGGSGIINILTSERNGSVVATFPAEDNEEIVIMTDKGKLIRCKVGEIRVAGRNTQGVTLLKTDNDEKVVSVAKVSSSEEEDLEENQEGNNELDNVVNEAVN